MAKKILLVEDEKILLDLLEKKLREVGYEVLTACNGEEGFEVLKKSEPKPDLILLDIIMPKLNGFEFMEKMRKEENLKNIPVIVISNSGQPIELDRAQKLGAKDWLIKTEFDPKAVIEKVIKYIGK